MYAPQPPWTHAEARYRVVGESRIIEMLLLQGWAFEVRNGERAAAQREAAGALAHWVRLGLRFATASDGWRLYDPAEVVNFFKWAGLNRGDPFYVERFIAQGHAMVLDFHGAGASVASPPSPAALGPRRLRVTLRREFDLRGAARGARVLLRLPTPLEDDAATDIALRFLVPPEIIADVARAPGRLDARLAAPGAPTLTLGVEATFTARPTAPGASPAPLAAVDRELYTRVGEGLLRISRRVASLAAALGGSEQAPAVLVRRFWDFIADEIAIGAVHYDELDAAAPLDLVLERRLADCQLASALLAALCRARGVPARVVSGYLVYPVSPGYHFWAEVWLPDRGWTPFDSMAIDHSARGRDPAWRDYFFGCLDYRMKTQCLPRVFNLAPSVRFPPAWHVLVRPEGAGTEIGTFANDTGALVYRDWVEIADADAAPSVNATPL